MSYPDPGPDYRYVPLNAFEREEADFRARRREALAKFDAVMAEALAIMKAALKEADDAWIVGGASDRDSYDYAASHLEAVLHDWRSDVSLWSDDDAG